MDMAKIHIPKEIKEKVVEQMKKAIEESNARFIAGISAEARRNLKTNKGFDSMEKVKEFTLYYKHWEYDRKTIDAVSSSIQQLNPDCDIEEVHHNEGVTIRAVDRKEQGPFQQMQYYIRNNVPLHLTSIETEGAKTEVTFQELEGMTFQLTEICRTWD